ncbi:hypothetical protein M9458_032137, partial [Cirrhinus mrigala]
VWIGCSGGSGLSKVVGKIFVLDSESLKVEKELEAHEDTRTDTYSAALQNVTAKSPSG